MIADVPRGSRVGSATSPAKTMPALRTAYAALLLATVLLGLATRRYPAFLPDFVARYGGDTLWATMIFWMLAVLWPRARTLPLGLTALIVCLAVETSQLYHAPWIDAIRATRLGGLALGYGFLWSDVLCYAVGVCIAVVVRQLVWRHDRTQLA